MIQIMQSIFSALKNQASLTAILGTDGLGNAAIYSDWGVRENGPYIIVSFVAISEEYYHQNSGTIQIDIFDAGDEEGGSYVRCLEIRNQIVGLLDGFHDLDGSENIRVFYTSEEPVTSDNGRHRRYNLAFEIRFNRSFDV